jgi:hypothetical protein
MRYDAVVRFALLVLVASCAEPASQPAQPQQPAAPTAERRITPRDKLPDVVKPLLPQRGFYAAGGGLVSSAWRVVVDRDAKTIYGGTVAGANAASFGKMDKETTKPLSQRNDAHLAQVCEVAWREAPVMSTDATADYDEILIIVDGDNAFYLQGFGPIKTPGAAKAIEELRAAAGL